MVQIDEIRKLVRKHEYEVALKIDKKGEIIAYFPHRKEKPFCETFSNVYKIEKEGVSCQLDDLKDFIEAPRYALRTLVFADVLRVCDIIGYDSKLLGLYVNKIEKSYQDFYDHMLSFRLTSKQTQKENDLEELMNEGRIFGFSKKIQDKAEEREVADGFKVIHSILIGEKL